MKRAAMIVGVLCLFLTPLAGFAEEGYCSGARILKVGGSVNDGRPINSVLLQNTRTDCGDWPHGAMTWFVMSDLNRDAMLATALTGLVGGLSVSIVSGVPDVYTNWGYISHIDVIAK